jgi:tRNA-2-methylthio-N6-dimethylallyladenosine synthase
MRSLPRYSTNLSEPTTYGSETLPLPSLESPRAETFRVETWGCQMNVLDGARMAGQLTGRGFRAAGDDERADVVLLNTCAVREKAEAKVYSALGVLGREKRDRPDMVIGVTGCVAQVEADEILERAPYVDFVLGTGQVGRVGETVAEIRRERRRIRRTELPRPEDAPDYQFREIAHPSPFQASITVIEGCDQFCTFCIVPFTRGRERSRRSEEIVAEARALVQSGRREILLLGQTVNAYRDPDDGAGLGTLLRRVAAVDGLARLRFITSHPSFVDDDLIAAMAECANVLPFLHLPAQSGSDRVLYRMKRRYDRRQYVETIGRLRDRIPEIAVSSDFIVGFPGESDEDFEQTLTLLSELRFAHVFAFCYSPRPGTAAARWGSETEVPAAVASQRLARLFAVQEEIQAETHAGLVGRVFPVLIDAHDARGQARGRTPCNRVVHLEAPADEDGNRLPRPAPGDMVPVRVVRGLPNSLIGRAVSAEEESW